MPARKKILSGLIVKRLWSSPVVRREPRTWAKFRLLFSSTHRFSFLIAIPDVR